MVEVADEVRFMCTFQKNYGQTKHVLLITCAQSTLLNASATMSALFDVFHRAG